MNPQGKTSRSLDNTTVILAAAAAIPLAIAFWQGHDLPEAGLLPAGRTLWRDLLILLLSFVIAGLIQVLAPKEWIPRWLGAEAGGKGVLAACVGGGLVPGAPYAVFPVVAAFSRPEASLGAVVGFVCARSLWSLSRLTIEMALGDPKAALVRYGMTFVVPPLAGLLANAATVGVRCMCSSCLKM